MTTITKTAFNLTNSAAVQNYVVEFNQFANKTAQAIIGMGRVVHRAKSTLGKDFGVFCAAIRFDTKSSAIRKLDQIGKMADFLDKYADRLPNTWTTVYRLTQLGNELLEQALENGDVISPTMSGIEAGRLVHQMQGTQPRSKKNKFVSPPVTEVVKSVNDDVYAFTIRFSVYPNLNEVKNIESLLDRVASESGNCSISRSDPLEALLNATNDALAA